MAHTFLNNTMYCVVISAHSTTLAQEEVTGASRA